MNFLTIKNSRGLCFQYFSHGGSFSMKASDVMINRFMGTLFDGNTNNIYLRLENSTHRSVYPLLGPQINPSFLQKEDRIEWCGSVFDQKIFFVCQLVLDKEETAWNWNVSIKNNSSHDLSADLICVQDIAVAPEDFVRRSEAYCSHYIDTTVFSSENLGYTLACRQNLETKGRHPWILMGSLQKTIAYATDELDFYGLSYKKNCFPEALIQKKLISRKSQYESTLLALQTEEFSVCKGATQSCQFFAHFEMDHPDITSEKDEKNCQKFREKAQKRIYKTISSEDTVKMSSTSVSFFQNTQEKAFINGVDLEEIDLKKMFSGEHRHKEYAEGSLLSFFYDKSIHVVLNRKELLSERPHGHILRSGNHLSPNNEDILSSTNGMCGLFHSHVCIGNTSFNKFLTISRSPLNIFSSTGQRIFIKKNGHWKLLNLPSAYEISPYSVRWIYKFFDDLVVVKVWVDPQETSCYLNVSSEKKSSFLIVNNVLSGLNESDENVPFSIDHQEASVQIFVREDSFFGKHYPHASFSIKASVPEDVKKIGTDELLNEAELSYGLPYVVFETKETSDFSLKMFGSLHSKKDSVTSTNSISLDEHGRENRLFWNDFLLKDSSFFLSKHSSENEHISQLSDICLWYAHNALIHYSSPHGLEQYTGAAWGVRDVCQGPVEFFLSLGHTSVVKDILKIVFKNQDFQTGDWPQWFMFDRYKSVRTQESHGDVILWPLKALSRYLRVSNDIDFLEERLSFIDQKTFESVGGEEYTLLDHVKKAVERIESAFISSTALSSYGGGDWNDTLQPANEELRASLVSSWTVALTYQTFRELIPPLKRLEAQSFADNVENLCEKIKDDFNRFLVKDSVVSGFALIDKDSSECIIHPSDKKFGVCYRLLPMIRSVIGELFESNQAKDHMDIIEEHLNFPDGVHLMDRPIAYKGGKRYYFQRAEEASYFGREVGMQYIHAHIRYIEATCRMGLASKAYEAILKILPIKIQDRFALANIRQSNVYVSSSDGDFQDRYLAEKFYLDLKKGTVRTKAGWRIYSSGPGIFLSQIFENFFGIRLAYGTVVIDPVLPQVLDQLLFEKTLFEKKISFCFHIESETPSRKEISINGSLIKNCSHEENRYRLGGVVIPVDIFQKNLLPSKNSIDVYLRD